MRWPALLLSLAVGAAACSSPGAAPPTSAETSTTTSTVPSLPFPPAPEVPEGPLAPETTAALDALFDDLEVSVDAGDVRALGRTGDARVSWLIADLLRFTVAETVVVAAVEALDDLTGVEFSTSLPWVAVTDHLIAWDLPAPPGYVGYKKRLFTAVDPRWEPFFTDDSDIDYRLISWGGVLMDDRPFGSTEPCERGCIPALDRPAVTPAAEGDWYPDDRIVFGVEIDGEARAYPKNIMEVHEMVNDTLGGRRYALPYCTLCGSAQLFFTDQVEGPEEPVMRTSGLLSRSNKVMFDLQTDSVFDTFTGRAVAGPLYADGVVLPQGSVVTTTWGDWKAAHPHTDVVAEDGGIGREYDLDPLGGRDDQGPIFPIGNRDLRVPVHQQVLGVIAPDGTPVAFPADAARRRLESGEPVELGGVELRQQAGGLVAHSTTGHPLVSHQAFWFAWSQFHPETLLWEPGS